MTEPREQSMPPQPFLMIEHGTAPRLEEEMPPPVRLPRGTGTVGLVLGGVAILIVGFAVLWSIGFVATLFAESPPLGWVGLAVAVAGFALLAAGVWRELAGLLSLRKVDRLRSALAGRDAARIRRAAEQWLAHVPERQTLTDALTTIEDPDAMRALLRTGIGQRLMADTDALGRTAAVQALALVAATPAPALDALILGWRGVRLVRQVAALHGLRPGLFGTLALLRRTALSAAAVAATEIAVNAAMHALTTNPLLRHLVGDAAAAGLAARRMVVLARAAALACNPLAGN